MRKLNAVISMLIMALFLVHAVAGSFVLAGFMQGGKAVLSVLAWVMTGLIALHTVIGIKLSVDTVRAIKRSGAFYFKENKLFILRRVSGLAIMAFILCHLIIFTGKSEGAYRLGFFGVGQLITQVLLVVSIALHVISNARPLMLSFGLKSYKQLGLDLALYASVILLISGIAFGIYYLRWL